MLARHYWPLIVGVGLTGALLGMIGTLAVQRLSDRREVSRDVRGPVNRNVQPREATSELATYVRAFNRKRGIVAAAKYGPYSCVYVVSTGSEREGFKVHLVRWGERPDGSPPPIGGIFDHPAAVLWETQVCRDQSVYLSGIGSSDLELVDLNGNGRREVVLLAGHVDGDSTVVIDFGQPEGQEELLWGGECPRATFVRTSFIDMDDDGRYEMIRMLTRPWDVKELIEEATKVSDDTGLEGCEDMYLVYRLDLAAAERERPPWVDRVFKPNDIHVGRDPLRYHLATVTGEYPVGSHD